jgi:DMSO/TMAO reductase YedYZ heme-binding membrane subunit
MQIKGWRITGCVAIVLLAVTGSSLLLWGFSEEFVRVVIRATARVSVALFLMAFTAASLNALVPSAATRWLRANRRYLGVSFALSHFTHLAALFTLGSYFPHPFVDELNAVTLIGGGLAYVFVTLMTITSFAGPRRWMGERSWSILHTTGSYYIWLIFLNSYVSRAVMDVAYAPYALALFIALGLRIAFWLKRRNSAAAQPA